MSTKETVIKVLESSKGTYISGEALAKQCGVSRNAVWKSITELKKSGYEIESVTNRGYMLREDNDIISKAGICLYLDKLKADDAMNKDTEGESIETLPVPDRIHVYEELDSTNAEAKRTVLFDNGHMLHGTVIVARHQTAGRGHGGSSFSSPDGGIYLSIILEPDKIKRTSEKITEIISEAVSTVIMGLFDMEVQKKDDSSLYVKDKKICGILTEGISDLETGIFSNYIAGIGIRTDKIREILTDRAGKINAEEMRKIQKGKMGESGRSPETFPDKNRVIAELIWHIVTFIQ